MAFIAIGDKNEPTIIHDHQGIDIFEVEDEKLNEFKQNCDTPTHEPYDWLGSNAIWRASVLVQDGNLTVRTQP